MTKPGDWISRAADDSKTHPAVHNTEQAQRRDVLAELGVFLRTELGVFLYGRTFFI